MTTPQNKEVNYKNKKKYKTAKYPIRQPVIITFLIWVLSNILLLGVKKKIEKVYFVCDITPDSTEFYQ